MTDKLTPANAWPFGEMIAAGQASADAPAEATVGLGANPDSPASAAATQAPTIPKHIAAHEFVKGDRNECAICGNDWLDTRHRTSVQSIACNYSVDGRCNDTKCVCGKKCKIDSAIAAVSVACEVTAKGLDRNNVTQAPTPRTDEVAVYGYVNSSLFHVVPASFARTLERELAAANLAIEDFAELHRVDEEQLAAAQAELKRANSMEGRTCWRDGCQNLAQLCDAHAIVLQEEITQQKILRLNEHLEGQRQTIKRLKEKLEGAYNSLREHMAMVRERDAQIAEKDRVSPVRQTAERR